MATPLTATNSVPFEEFCVGDAVACAAAQLSARRMARTLGFPEAASEELALAVAELASNLVKHAGSGTLLLRPLRGSGRTGLEVETSDSGPGISNVEKSFADGYSTSGSLGYGLGTVNRLMDEVDIHSTAGSGTHLVCRRRIREGGGAERAHLWDVSVFTRPSRLCVENGDAFLIKHGNGELLTGLIDGLGHGEFAQRAAAQQYVQSHDTLPLDKIYMGAGRACRGTRGAVMALARFKSPRLLQFASIGNIEVRAWCDEERVPFTLKRGFLGAEEIKVQVQEFAWKPEWLLVLHSDGLRTQWQWSDFPGIQREPAQVVASKLMRALATESDDATVLAVRGRTP